MQSVARPTVDPGVLRSIPAWSHTFMEIDHEIIFTHHSPRSADSRGVNVVSYKRKYVHKVLAKRLRKKVWLGELTITT